VANAAPGPLTDLDLVWRYDPIDHGIAPDINRLFEVGTGPRRYDAARKLI